MLLRMHFVCACGQVWVVTAKDNFQAECSECGTKSWPAEMYDAADERWELAGPQPSKPVQIPATAYEGFAAVCELKVEQTPAGKQTVAPFYTPPSTGERVQLLAEAPYSQKRDRFAKARPMTEGLFDEDARNQLDMFDRSSK